MFVFNEKSTQKTLTPWGKEVKRCVLELDIMQNDIVSYLNSLGFNINKNHFTNLLYGIGVSAHKAEIHAVNEYLGIPYEESQTEKTV